MIRLASSEWLRFSSRRLVRVLVLLVIVGIAATGVIATATSHRPTPAQAARAQQQVEQYVARCIEHPQNFSVQVEPGVSAEGACRGLLTEDAFVSANQIRLGELPTILQGISFIMILIGLVIGASMVGASWQSGTITTILTWEPRRILWFLTRALVTVVGVLLIAVVLLMLFSLAIAAAASLRGSTTLPPDWFGEVARTILRVAAVAASASLIGAAVAMIGRNTAAALGAVFVYMAVLEGVVRGLRPGLAHYLLGTNIAAFIANTRIEIYDGSRSSFVSPARGGVTLAIYVVVLVAAAVLFLRSRDVN